MEGTDAGKHEAAAGRPGQARSVERRAQLRAAAIELLLTRGVGAVTHRGVAEAADSSPGAVRYHFHSREDLLVACVEEIERVRSAGADSLIAELGHDGPRDEDGVALLLIRAYYGPEVDDASVTGMFWSIVDCGREGPRLAELLGSYRRTATGQLADILSACGYRTLRPSLAAAVLDGCILTATVEGHSPVTESAAADVSAILGMTGPRGPVAPTVDGRS